MNNIYIYIRLQKFEKKGKKMETVKKIEKKYVNIASLQH